MMRSLFAGVAGLRSHQTAMDVVGNNVSNANTLAYKASRTTFREGYSQMIRSASRPQDGVGGTNAQQVGLGVGIGSIDTLFNQGSFEATGLATDLAIQGNSFFVVSNAGSNFYTRAGNFQLDQGGRLVVPGNGYVLQGRTAINGELGGPIGNIQLPFGTKAPARATSNAILNGNLDASAPAFVDGAGDPASAMDPALRELPANKNAWSETTINVYDSLGARHEMRIVMWKTGDGTWNWEVDPSASMLDTPAPTGSGTLEFGSDGLLTTASPVGPITFTPANGGEPTSISVDIGSGIRGLTQYASRTTAVLREQDGYTMGMLADFGIDQSGTITGTFDNGVTMVLAQVAMADFNNPGGLIRSDSNMFLASSNSGEPVIGYGGDTSPSSISSGTLEMSNVDLAQEFTKMIVYQRGFAASGRVITVADEMLQEVVALKR
jgi:flagellar hook protein FlgE